MIGVRKSERNVSTDLSKTEGLKLAFKSGLIDWSGVTSAMPHRWAMASTSCESFSDSGYRVYFVQRDSVVVLLLSGCDKSSQTVDIAKAKEIAKQLEV